MRQLLHCILPCLSVVRQEGPAAPLLFADVIASPGATKSGLILLSYAGPFELKYETNPISVEYKVLCEDPTETEFFEVLSIDVDESWPAFPAA